MATSAITAWSVTFAASDTSKAVTFADVGETNYSIFPSHDQNGFYEFTVDPATKTSSGFTLAVSSPPGASLTVTGIVVPR